MPPPTRRPDELTATATATVAGPALRRIAGSPCRTRREGWFGASRGIYNAAGVRMGFATANAGPYTGHTYSVYVGTQLGATTLDTRVHTLAQAAELLAAHANGSGRGR